MQAWPTVILIDPEGYAVWGTSGEITFEQVDKVIRAGMPYYRQKKLLDETPLRFDMERQAAAATPLRFPGKILADEASGRLFIADSNHNRIVVAKLDGTLLDVIGSGVAGRSDGDFATAQFNQPQGMALRGRRLFVADTENHEIRRVDLAAGKVDDRRRHGPAGPRAGRPGPAVRSAAHGPQQPLGPLPARRRPLHRHGRLPPDLEDAAATARRSALTPATAGRTSSTARCCPSRPTSSGSASFAQPSGLAGDGTWLYVADSEGSSIRAVPLNPRAEVRTVVGTSQLPVARLFTFGDVDGPAGQARFQHPLGVAFHEGRLYVADTYNNKIRVVDPADGTTRTLAGLVVRL